MVQQSPCGKFEYCTGLTSMVTVAFSNPVEVASLTIEPAFSSCLDYNRHLRPMLYPIESRLPGAQAFVTFKIKKLQFSLKEPVPQISFKPEEIQAGSQYIIPTPSPDFTSVVSLTIISIWPPVEFSGIRELLIRYLGDCCNCHLSVVHG